MKVDLKISTCVLIECIKNYVFVFASILWKHVPIWNNYARHVFPHKVGKNYTNLDIPPVLVCIKNTKTC